MTSVTSYLDKDGVAFGHVQHVGGFLQGVERTGTQMNPASCGRKKVYYLTTLSTHFNTVIWRRAYGKVPL